MLKRQKIEPLDFAGMFRSQFGKVRFSPFCYSEKVAYLRSQPGRLGECIDERKLTGMLEQGLLFMLAVNVQQQRSQFPQRRHCSRLVVEVDTVPLVGRNLTA